MKILPGATQLALLHLQQKSLRDEYYNDPVLWAKEVLGVHLWGKQQEIMYSVRDHKRTAVRSANGTGKDLPLDTPLPTPTGWTTMGEVQVGDFLLDEMGKPTRVVGKSEVMHNPLFEVTFNDGATQVASGTHEWNTITHNRISRIRQTRGAFADFRDIWNESTTVTTSEIAQTTLTKGGKPNHYIPANAPLDLPEADLPIDPYVLGVWLGDGTSNECTITLGRPKNHIVPEFALRGVSLAPQFETESSIRWKFTYQGFRPKLRALGVLNNKHVPPQYLRASYQQRLDLLRGLMDTDGTRDKRGKNFKSSITQVREQMANDILELCRTLGLLASKTQSNTDGTFMVSFTSQINPFSAVSPKAQGAVKAKSHTSRMTARNIVSVKSVETVPTQCVQVDSPRNLYLAGEHMIPTHNSFTVGVLAAWWIATRYFRDPMQTIVVTTAPSFPQIKTNVFHEFKMAMHRSKEPNYEDGRPKGEAYQPLPGKINDSGNVAEWKADGSLLALGRKPADGEIITTFQGIHRRNVLFIVDEAGGMPRDAFVAAERMTTNENAKIIAVGNPDKRGSEFYKMFYDPDVSPLWNPIKISSYDTPTFTGEECPQELLDGMPTKQWVADNIKAWGGLDDPRVQIAILGEFPDSDDSVFFSEKIINLAEETDIDPNLAEHRILGIDLAMHGLDESRAYINDGGHIRLAGAWPGGTATENARKILEIVETTRAEYVNIDSGGIGTPIIERLLELAEEENYNDFVVTMMNGSQNSPDVRQWYNNRAYWYDLLRRRMIDREVDLDVSDDLRKQLTDINYEIWQTGNRAGSILMESKRDMRARVGYSPDDVDGIVYANMDPTKDLATGGPKITYETPEELLGGEAEMPDYLRMIDGLW